MSKLDELDAAERAGSIIMRDEMRALIDIARTAARLQKEVSGTMALGESVLREAIGNTNVACLREALWAAEAALARLEAE